MEWPHSLRATRVKLIELARNRAREENMPLSRKATVEKEDDLATSVEDSRYDGEVLQQTTNIGNIGIGLGSRRPLYRQSSMDFMNSSTTDLADNDDLLRSVLLRFHSMP